MRQHRRLSIVGAIFLVLVSAGAAATLTKNKSPSASSQASTPERVPHSTVPHRGRTRHVASASRAATSRRHKPIVRPAACRAPGDVLAGVWHPSRLRVLADCQRAVGRVITVRHEQDGDLHFNLATDPAYDFLLNEGNLSMQGGVLVVEFMPRDGGHLPAPTVGDHLTVTGAWVYDADQGWNELHPVWSEQIAAGGVHHSGPQYGGSPATDSSYNAKSNCRNASGQRCQGYA